MKYIYLLKISCVVVLGLILNESAYCATFPTRSEMRSRLTQVETDTKLRDEFFPLLYMYANQNKSPDEVTSIFLTAIDEFSKKQKSSGMIRAQLVPRSFIYIRKLFIESPDETQKILEILNKKWLDENNH